MAETTGKAEYFVGVDLGGTKILAGVFKHSLECIGTAKLSTKSQRGVEPVIERIARCVQDAVDEADLSLKQVAGVGIGAPGAVDFAEGTSHLRPQPGGLEGRAAQEGPRKASRRARVRGERLQHLPPSASTSPNSNPSPRTWSASSSAPASAAASSSTASFTAASTIPPAKSATWSWTLNGPKCGCGNKGCFEALASRTAIFQQIKAGIKDGQKTVLTEMLGDDLSDLRSGDLRKAIRRGDKFVDKVVEGAAEYIGIGIANLVNILGPEVVVVGGGVIEALADEMMSVIVETAQDYAMPGTMKGVEIIASKLGDNAGITGGAVLARRETK